MNARYLGTVGLLVWTIGACDADSGERDSDTTDASEVEQGPHCGDGVCLLPESFGCPNGASSCIACESDCGDGMGHFIAVIIDDSHIFPEHRTVGTDPCATAAAPLYMHGADIDAVGLFDGPDLVGYFESVDYQEGGLCPAKPNGRTDPQAAIGKPDASLTDGAVSLGGGWLVGEFTGAAAIQSGYSLSVYEVGNCDDAGGLTEGYDVFIAEGMDCPHTSGYPYSSCAMHLMTVDGCLESIPVTGF